MIAVGKWYLYALGLIVCTLLGACSSTDSADLEPAELVDFDPTGKIETQPIPIEMRRKHLGGRGLDMYLLYNHTKAGIDPLGPDNVALVSAGLLVG
ncbi:MAG: aldehyde ferredoxin oxidoreductase N-terminal domain-containing protein, partial [Exilibacterium sp.]